MRNGKENDASFVSFYDMRAVTIVMPDEMADLCVDRGTAVVYSYTPISSPIYIEKKKRDLERESSTCCTPTNYEKCRLSSFI